MPLPKTTDVGKLIGFLKKDKPGMPHKQRIAIAISQARKSGAKIKRPKKKKKGKKKLSRK